VRRSEEFSVATWSIRLAWTPWSKNFDEAAKLENRKSVDQNRNDILRFLSDRPDIFARQGTVRESWRYYGGRRLGPYFKLSYRIGGKQQARYLGSSPEFAAEVRHKLVTMQAELRQQRRRNQELAPWYKAVSSCKQQWQLEVEKLGLRVQGYEVRGYRQLRQAKDLTNRPAAKKAGNCDLAPSEDES
jgi:hypothetical protein